MALYMTFRIDHGLNGSSRQPLKVACSRYQQLLEGACGIIEGNFSWLLIVFMPVDDIQCKGWSQRNIYGLGRA